MSFVQDYRKDIVPALQKKLGIKNIHALPKIEKIVVNVGTGTYLKGEKNADTVVDSIALITGQKPVIKKARMSISNFKLREGMPVGVSVTLRGNRAYDFFERLVKIVFPRIRDFRGFSPRAFDGRGNYSLGIRDHLIFPEIPSDEILKSFGVEVTLVVKNSDDKKTRALLDEFGFPFRK